MEVDKECAPPVPPRPVPGSWRADCFVAGILSGRGPTPAYSGRRRVGEAMDTENDQEEMSRRLLRPPLLAKAGSSGPSGCLLAVQRAASLERVFLRDGPSSYRELTRDSVVPRQP